MYRPNQARKLVAKPITKKRNKLVLQRPAVCKNKVPWDPSLKTTTEKIFSQRVVHKVVTVEIPQPDFIGVPYREKLCLKNGKAVNIGEGIVYRENYKTAPWASEKTHELRILQCHQWGNGFSVVRNTVIPNNYRTVCGPNFKDTNCGGISPWGVCTSMNNKFIMQLL